MIDLINVIIGALLSGGLVTAFFTMYKWRTEKLPISVSASQDSVQTISAVLTIVKEELEEANKKVLALEDQIRLLRQEVQDMRVNRLKLQEVIADLEIQLRTKTNEKN